MFHRANESLRDGRAADLCKRRKLPIRFVCMRLNLSAPSDVCGSVTKTSQSKKTTRASSRALNFEFWRATDELGQLWGADYQLMEVDYIQLVEQRGIDLGLEDLQIFGSSFETRHSENREEGACLWRRTSAVPVGATWRGFELNDECFEAGQHGEAGDHRLGCRPGAPSGIDPKD